MPGVAATRGRRVALMSAFLDAAFRRGINTNSEAGLRAVVEQAGLSWVEARQHLGSEHWQAELEKNRLAMYRFGAWGVPTFRLLDAEGDAETTGKPVGQDAAAGKATFVSILGVERARAQAHLLVEQAVRHLELFDDVADPLRAVARFVVERSN